MAVSWVPLTAVYRLSPCLREVQLVNDLKNQLEVDARLVSVLGMAARF